MTIRSMEVKRTQLAEAIERLDEAGWKIVFITPTMLSYFATSPERYEVSAYVVHYKARTSKKKYYPTPKEVKLT